MSKPAFSTAAAGDAIKDIEEHGTTGLSLIMATNARDQLQAAVDLVTGLIQYIIKPEPGDKALEGDQFVDIILDILEEGKLHGA